MTLPKVFDSRIPITWVLSGATAFFTGAAVLIWAVSAANSDVNGQLKAISMQLAEAKQQTAVDRAKVDAMVNSIFQLQLQNATQEGELRNQEFRIDTLEKLMGMKIPLRKER